jgi:hypothetical protein
LCKDGTTTPFRREQKAVDLITELLYRFTLPYSSSEVTYVMDLTSGTGTNAFYINLN